MSYPVDTQPGTTYRGKDANLYIDGVLVGEVKDFTWRIDRNAQWYPQVGREKQRVKTGPLSVVLRLMRYKINHWLLQLGTPDPDGTGFAASSSGDSYIYPKKFNIQMRAKSINDDNSDAKWSKTFNACTVVSNNGRLPSESDIDEAAEIWAEGYTANDGVVA